MQQFSYHTHTNFSDGVNTLEEMLEQAVKLGWKEIGISDHLMIHKNYKQSSVWNLVVQKGNYDIYRESFEKSLPDFQAHSRHVRETAAKYPIKVYLGYEVDYYTYDGWLESFKAFIKEIDYDYLVSGNHFFMSDDGEDVLDVYLYEKGPDATDLKKFEKLLSGHYKAMIEAIQTGMFSFLAHLDYARRASLHKHFPMIEERKAVVRALKEAGMACEVSTKGLRRVGDFYPEETILKELIKQDIPLVISDDAHRISELGMDFEKAEAYLQKLGAKNRWHLK